MFTTIFGEFSFREAVLSLEPTLRHASHNNSEHTCKFVNYHEGLDEVW